jgi:hypothetical protein
LIHQKIKKIFLVFFLDCLLLDRVEIVIIDEGTSIFFVKSLSILHQRPWIHRLQLVFADYIAFLVLVCDLLVAFWRIVQIYCLRWLRIVWWLILLISVLIIVRHLLFEGELIRITGILHYVWFCHLFSEATSISKLVFFLILIWVLPTIILSLHFQVLWCCIFYFIIVTFYKIATFHVLTYFICLIMLFVGLLCMVSFRLQLIEPYWNFSLAFLLRITHLCDL